jgi:hypothetical protein
MKASTSSNSKPTRDRDDKGIQNGKVNLRRGECRLQGKNSDGMNGRTRAEAKTEANLRTAQIPEE